MAKFMKNSLILAALQVGIGVAANAVAATDAMLVSNISAKPVSADYVARDNVKPFFGNNQQLTAGNHAELDFEIELAGAGEPGAVPKWGRLMIPCSFAETVTEGVSVIYKPVSVQIATPLTLYYYMDGLLHKITDAYGTVSWDITSKQVSKFKFHFMGVYNPVTDSPVPAGSDFSGFLTPTVANTASTTWEMHDYTGPLQTLSLDIANTLTWSETIGYARAEISDRVPTGKITLQLGSVADKDWWTTAVEALLGSLTITQGKTPGNIVKFDAPAVQLTEPTYTNTDGKAFLDATLTINPLDGDDDLTITVM